MDLSSVAFTAFPTSRLTRFDSQPFRVLLLRRLHLPLTLSARACRCGRPLDAFGHHRSACATSGVLGRRGFPLESAAARVCREAGARVRTNVWSGTWTSCLTTGSTTGGWRLSPMASPCMGERSWPSIPHLRDGSVKRGADRTDGAVLVEARRRKERTYPELAGVGGRAKLVVLAAEVGGRWSQGSRQFLIPLASTKALSAPYLLQSKAELLVGVHRG